jgi:hypothetical protein
LVWSLYSGPVQRAIQLKPALWPVAGAGRLHRSAVLSRGLSYRSGAARSKGRRRGDQPAQRTFE